MGDTSSWERYSGTLIGPPSKKRGKPNQDYCEEAVIVTDEGNVFSVIAVADGAGSLDLSHIGAELAVKTVLESTEEYLIKSRPYSVEQAAHVATYEARKELLDHPEKSQLGCTLAFAIIDENRGQYAVSLTGDAFGILNTDSAEFELLHNPASGEYANITKLLTSKDTDTTVSTGYTDDISGIAVSSDGLTHFTIDSATQTPTQGFWNTVFSKAQQKDLDIVSLFEYMRSVDKIDDDTTMIVSTKN